MIGKKLIAQKPIPLAEVKDLLKARQDEKALAYEQEMAYDYARKHSKLSKSKAEKLLEELQSVEVSDEIKVKIVDLCPDNLDKLRLLLPKSSKISEEDLKAIVEKVKAAAA